MAIDPVLADQQLLADTFERFDAPPTRREQLVGGISAAVLLLASAGLWLVQPPGSFDSTAALGCILVLAVASRVQFDTPLGFTVPTQLAFVPLLFVVPPALVPAATVTGLMLGGLPELARRRIPAGRLLQVPANAWFSAGPAAVFASATSAPWKAGALVLLAALAAQFAIDFVASTARYAASHGASLASQLRETWVYGIDATLSAVALVIARATREDAAAVLTLLPLLAPMALFARERRQRLQGLVELNNAYRGTALVLGDVVEADDGYTGRHSKSVVALAVEVGALLQLSPEQERNLEFGALLHDVGKVAVPKEIINNPGSLNAREWEVIKTHTLEGQRMLARVGGFMRQVGLIVRSHHERWDGTGYPDGLSGRDIPVEARIITCCDSWNAMRTDRVYRRALPYEAALAEMRTNTGSQFDPQVVEALLAIVDTGDRPPRSPAPAPQALASSAPTPDPKPGRDQRVKDAAGRV